MSERSPSTSGLEETEFSTCRHGQASHGIPRRGSRGTGGALETSLPPLGDSVDPTRSVAKLPTSRHSPTNSADGQASLRHNLLHHYSSSASRTPSTTTSSSSLQALSEGAVVDVRSDPNVRSCPASRGASQGSSHHHGLSDPSSNDYPVYPEQSYAVLQSQVHPTYRPPSLRSRKSYPLAVDTRPRSLRASRTAGNTPDSSPGLFSLKGLSKAPFSASDDEGRVSSPYLHPTHLQPPKE